MDAENFQYTGTQYYRTSNDPNNTKVWKIIFWTIFALLVAGGLTVLGIYLYLVIISVKIDPYDPPDNPNSLCPPGTGPSGHYRGKLPVEVYYLLWGDQGILVGNYDDEYELVVNSEENNFVVCSSPESSKLICGPTTYNLTEECVLNVTKLAPCFKDFMACEGIKSYTIQEQDIYYYPEEDKIKGSVDILAKVQDLPGKVQVKVNNAVFDKITDGFWCTESDSNEVPC